MSPIIHIGPPCSLCVTENVTPAGPAWRDGVCSAHWYREAAMGRVSLVTGPEPTVAELEALYALPAAEPRRVA